MSDSLVERLLGSFDELERCIEVTKTTLSGRVGVSTEVLNRVNQYSNVVEKQRKFAVQLKDGIEAQDWAEVSRLVRIINGLSTMIRDDAHAILAGTVPSEQSSEKSNINLC